MKKLTIPAIISFVLQGCSSVVVTPEQQLQVKSLLPKVEQNKAQVCFVREGGMAPTWSPDVAENGTKIGELAYNSYFCHNTTNGEHKYIASTVLDFDREININLDKDTRSYVDYSISMGILSGNGELKEINESEALSKIFIIENK